MSSQPGPVLDHQTPGAPRQTDRPGGSRWRRGVEYAVSRLLIVTGLGTLAGFFGSTWWVLDLSAHFRVQYAIALTIATVPLAALRQYIPATLVLLLAGVNLATVLSAVMPGPTPNTSSHASSHRPLHLLHFNIYTANRHHAEVASYIDQSDADVVCLQEVDQAWAAALQERLKNHHFIHASLRSDNFGAAMFLRSDGQAELSLIDVRSIELGGVGVPAIEAHLQWQGHEVVLLAVHTLPPFSASYTAGRDRQLRDVAAWAARQTVPVIVVGDLNITPWSSAFTPLEAQGGLINSMRGQSLGRSWPADGSLRSWLLRIPIDHCLHSRQWRVESRRLGPSGLGSDHLPLLVDLQLIDDATTSTNP